MRPLRHLPVIVAVSLLVPLLTLTSAAYATVRPATLVALALRDASSATWVTQNTSVSDPGVYSESASETVSSTAAYGTVTTSGILGTGTISVIELASLQQVFIEGSGPSLVALDATTFSTNSDTYANQWIELLPNTSNSAETADYGDFDDSTIASTFAPSAFHFTGSPTVSPIRSYAGQRVRAITGTISGATHATLYVTAAPRPLPVAMRITSSNEVLSVKWSAWNTGTTPAAPTTPLAFPTPSTTPPVTTTTTPASANFCADVAALTPTSATTTPTTTSNTNTRAQTIRTLSAALARVPALYAAIEATVASAPTPAIAAAYTQLLTDTHSLAYVLTQYLTAAKRLAPRATTKQINALANEYFGALFVIATYSQAATAPVTTTVSAYCPATTTTTTTTTP